MVVAVVDLGHKRCVELVDLGLETGVLGDHGVVLVHMLGLVLLEFVLEFADLMLQMAELAGCTVGLVDQLDEYMLAHKMLTLKRDLKRIRTRMTSFRS
jgi:hypothetical protein